jgi:hypothetical protein
LVQIFSSIIDPKIPRRSRVACNLAIIGHRPVEVPIYILVTYITPPFLLLRYLSILMIIAWRTYLAIPSDCFHISWTLCFIPFGSRSTFMWRIYNAIWRHLKFRFRQERNAFICPFDKEIRVKWKVELIGVAAYRQCRHLPIHYVDMHNVNPLIFHLYK